jgi:hypothetical protein
MNTHGVLILGLMGMAAIGGYLITHDHEAGGWWILGLSFLFLVVAGLEVKV